MGLFEAALSRVKVFCSHKVMKSNAFGGLSIVQLLMRSDRTGQPSPTPMQTPRRYSAPQLRKLEPEQAKLLLTGHAVVGDRGARELLELIFPESGKQPALGSTSEKSLVRGSQHSSRRSS